MKCQKSNYQSSLLFNEVNQAQRHVKSSCSLTQAVQNLDALKLILINKEDISLA